MNIQAMADALWDAEEQGRQIEALTALHPHMTVQDAYAVQLANISRRISGGEALVGMKIGLTSKAMQQLLGVSEPDYGHLTNRMLVPEADACSMQGLLQPKVEGELAFCLSKPLRGPGITVAHVYNATAWVVPAIEVVDSRIRDWKITLRDTIADNGSSARLILGTGMTPIHQVDMRLVGMTLEKNGRLVNSGTGAEVLGNPAEAVAWLANKLAEFDIGLEAGHIVLSGALTAAQPAVAGDCFTVSFHGMGSVTARFE